MFPEQEMHKLQGESVLKYSLDVCLNAQYENVRLIIHVEFEVCRNQDKNIK